MKNSELTGAALNCAVAKALGLDVDKDGNRHWQRVFDELDDFLIPKFSSDPAAAMPIIEQHIKYIERVNDGRGMWCAGIKRNNGWFHAHGPTAIVAAMRCFVVSRLGNEVKQE